MDASSVWTVEGMISNHTVTDTQVYVVQEPDGHHYRTAIKGSVQSYKLAQELAGMVWRGHSEEGKYAEADRRLMSVLGREVAVNKVFWVGTPLCKEESMICDFPISEIESAAGMCSHRSTKSKNTSL